MKFFNFAMLRMTKTNKFYSIIPILSFQSRTLQTDSSRRLSPISPLLRACKTASYCVFKSLVIIRSFPARTAFTAASPLSMFSTAPIAISSVTITPLKSISFRKNSCTAEESVAILSLSIASIILCETSIASQPFSIAAAKGTKSFRLR